MTRVKLLSVTVLGASLLLALATACQHSAVAAAPPETAQAPSPAPFATPPVLPGTPDVATLTAKVRPAVVNITAIQQVRGPRGFQIGPDLGEIFPFLHPGPGGHGRGGEGGGDPVMKQ